jgi:D-amino-acid dehydrogenase
MSDFRDDVIILGGGAIGACTAYYLRKMGISVTLIERDRIGEACSSGNAGLISPSHYIPLAAPGVIRKGLRWMMDPESPFYIRPRWSWDLFRWLLRFRAACTETRVRQSASALHGILQLSRSLFAEYAREHPNDFGYAERGLLTVCQTQEGLEEEKHAAAVGRELGVDVRLLDADGIRQIEPDVRVNAIGGLFYPEDAHLEPASFMRNLKERLVASGVNIMEDTEAFYFKTSTDRGVDLMTSQGVCSARTIVLALGSWSPALMGSLNVSLPVQAGKGYSITLDHLPLKMNTPFILAEARVVLTPMAGKLRLAGTMELSGVNLTIRPRRVQAIISSAARYFPDFNPESVRALPAWTGMRPLSPDGLPIIGRFSKHPNIIAATGHSMLGITLAPATGKLISEMLADRPTSVPLMPFSPARFG